MQSLKRNLVNLFSRYMPNVRSYFMLIKNKNSYLHTTGWMNSLKNGKPVDSEGCEVPWMNYSMITFLKERLKTDFQLFEFGSGYSTLFYAKLVQEVTSVEHDQTWHLHIKEMISENVELIYTEEDTDGLYCRVVSASGKKFDVIVVDGVDRVNCIKQSIDSLTDRGVLILDDSQRKGYVDGINHAKDKGFLALTFEGLKPKGNGVERTTLFYRRDNCLNI
jgi:hypothetical protein